MKGDKIALLTLALAIVLIIISYVTFLDRENLQDDPMDGALPITPIAPAVPGAVVPVIPPDIMDQEDEDKD